MANTKRRSKQEEPLVEITIAVPWNTRPLPEGEMSVRDAANVLDTSTETLRRWCKEGRIEGREAHSGARGRAGWRWVIPTAEIERIRDYFDEGVA